MLETNYGTLNFNNLNVCVCLDTLFSMLSCCSGHVTLIVNVASF